MYYSLFQRLRDLGLQYLNESVPIGGIGIQGHIHNVDVMTIKVSIPSQH